MRYDRQRRAVFTGLLAIVCFAATKAAVHAHDPIEDGRIGEATLVRIAGRDRGVPVQARVQAIVALLALELRDPTPAEQWGRPPYTATEVVQSRLIRAFAEVGDTAAVAAAYGAAERHPELAKRLAIGLGMSIGPEDDRAIANAVAPLISDVMLHDRSEFTRSKAAKALGAVALAHPPLRADAVAALTQALRDPGPDRVSWSDAGSPGHRSLNLVRGAAAGSLGRLGLDVRGTQVSGKPTAAARRVADIGAGASRGRAALRWVTAKAALKERGYSFHWNAPKRQVDGSRGSRRIRLRVGDYTALVNGRPVRMDLPPHRVGGQVRIAATFARRIASR